MKKEILNKYKNKQTRLFLSNGRLYTCTILAVSEDTTNIIDKFGLLVTISNECIQQIELIEGDGENDRRN